MNGITYTRQGDYNPVSYTHLKEAVHSPGKARAILIGFEAPDFTADQLIGNSLAIVGGNLHHGQGRPAVFRCV